MGKVVKTTAYEELDKHIKIILSDEEQELFIREVQKLNSDNFLKEYWKDEDVNEYVRQTEIAHAKEESKNDTANEFIKNMLLNGADLNFISKVSGKSTKEIKILQKQLTN